MLMIRHRYNIIICVWFGLLLTISTTLTRANEENNPLFSAAQSENPFTSQTATSSSVEFLPVDEAFKLTGQRTSDNELVISWQITPDYYLYRGRTEFNAANNQDVAVTFRQPGIKKVDEYFGEVEVYYNSMVVQLSSQQFAATNGENKPLDLEVTYQGCAEAGLCYPPKTKLLSFTNNNDIVLATDVSLDNNSQSTSSNTTSTPSNANPLSAMLFEGNFLGSVFFFFLAGIGLAFTPCVLPMVPILSSIIVGAGENTSTRKAFNLSLVYVLGMALTYTILGIVVGLLGAEYNLSAKMQSPIVLGTLSAIFIALAGSMFGLYELELPNALRQRLDQLNQNQKGGEYLGVAMMGIISAVVVSPCVSVPLIGALAYLSTTGDALLGGSALFALSLGMGIPLILVGVGQGHYLPSTGVWMNTVKAAFGILLLGVAIWLLERLLAGPLVLALWAGLLLSTSVYLGVLEPIKDKGLPQLGKALGLFLMVYGILLLIGAASGADDPLKPLAKISTTSPATQSMSTNSKENLPVATVYNLKQFEQVLVSAKNNQQKVLLDFYADWCISCKVMERNVFANKQVIGALQEYQFVRADVTNVDPEQTAFLKHFGLFGPPSLLFFDGNGNELRQFRIQGDMNKDQFLIHLQEIASNAQQLAKTSF